MDQVELFVAAVVVNLCLTVLATVIASRIAVEVFNHRAKQQLANQEALLKYRNHTMKVREEAVTLAERDFAHRTAQAVAALHATEQAMADDTTIHDMEWEPELQDRLNDTVMLPRIEEEL